ncbi:MAG: M48 family metallopeptidase [Chloroflexi bacterium]|nr:M48 family metallopeptidase [Chloroflexota bacterium]
MNITAERQEKAKKYAQLRRWLFLAELGISAVFLVALLVSAVSRTLKVYVQQIAEEQLLHIALYFLVLTFVYLFIQFPLALYGGFILPHRFGLSVQTVSGWLVDWIKGSLLSLGFGLILVEGLYYLLRVQPEVWWIWSGLLLFLFSAVLTNLAPILIVPLFYKFTAVTDEALIDRLANLAKRAGTMVHGVYILNLSSKATTANASLMGLGNTRRIVLGDTLLERYTLDEIETIFAHELGHHRHADIPKAVAVQSMLTLFGLYLANLFLRWSVGILGYDGIADIAAFPLVILWLGVFGSITLPLINAFSRHLETAADRYALELTQKPQSFGTALLKLADQNLSELQPGRWVEWLFYDHPPFTKRIKLAEEYARHRSSSSEASNRE